MYNKKRKIGFFSITKKMWKNNAEGIEGEYPFFELKELITFINELDENERNYDLKGYKTCSLMSVSLKEIENAIIFTGVFKSAQYRYRPSLWDTKTNEERPNPKKINEGEKEKTHFAVKITEDEVFFVLETNGNGISITNVICYLKSFHIKYLTSIDKKQNSSIQYTKIARGDFLEVLGNLKRTKVAEVYLNKSLLGGDGLNFSNRTYGLQRNVVLTLKAEKNQSFTETVIDIFNKFNKQEIKDSISKIRIQGKNEDNEDTILDTSFMEKIEYIDVSINQSTGEVETIEMLTFLKSFLDNL